MIRWSSLVALQCAVISLPLFRGATLLDTLYYFLDASASSTNVGASPTEFSAKRAIQPGTGYWCSEGDHDSDTVVTWTGVLSGKATLAGLKVKWAYSPKEVQVAAVGDDDRQNVVLDWHKTPSTIQSFDEELTFTKPSIAKKIILSMRGPINTYFGLTYVTPVAASIPVIFIISGITSHQGELCLQVANGQINKNSAKVVLDYCSTAIAAADGREFWQLTPNDQLASALSRPQKCLTLDGMNTTDGGQLILSDCDEALSAEDGRSTWEFAGNGQLLLLGHNKSYSLSQKGTAAGFTNIAQKTTKVTASSVADANHKPEKAVDGNAETYWASLAFPDTNEHTVVYDLAFDAPMMVSQVHINWEYPPFMFSILASDDATTWVELAHIRANPMNVTMTEVATQTQYLRISMQKPHPTLGKVHDKFVYGIIDLQVKSNRLTSIVELRQNANLHEDSRDKYFPKPVHEFDPALSSAILSMRDDLEARLKGVQEASIEIQEALPKFESCVQKKQKETAQMTQLIEKTDALKQNTTQLEHLTGSQVTSRARIGSSRLFPAESCQQVVALTPDTSSGFYWLLPRCSPEAFRAWCDVSSGSMYYFWNGNPPRKPNTPITSSISSKESIRLKCAEAGLEPIVIRQRSDVDSLVLVAQTMGYDLGSNGTIPLAFDHSCETGKCLGQFQDFSGGSDVTNILIEVSSNSMGESLLGYNAAGLGRGGSPISFFDLETTEIVAIVCSTNTEDTSTSPQSLRLKCDDTAESHTAFQGSTGTNFIVKCPAGCLEDRTAPVYGRDHVYHISSSICRAGLHSGVIKQGGLMSVALEVAKDSYDGISKNGIRSENRDNPDNTLSLRVDPLPQTCPIDVINFIKPPSSFLELNSQPAHDSSLKPESQLISFLEVPASLPPIEVEPEVNAEVSKVYDMIDELHNIDPTLVNEVSASCRDLIGNARKFLKPAQEIARDQGKRSLVLFDAAQEASESLYTLTSVVYSTLEDITSEAQHMTEEGQRQQPTATFVWNPAIDPIATSWSLSTSLGVSGTPTWRQNEQPNSIIQNGVVVRNVEAYGLGTVALLKNRNFYDFSMEAAAVATGDQSVFGIGFRVRNPENMYLLEIERLQTGGGGVKRLLKVYQGTASVLEESIDGGYVPKTLYFVRIETVQSLLRVFIGESLKSTKMIFEVQDGTFSSGTIALLTANTSPSASVRFQDIQVHAKPCLKSSRCLRAPYTPECRLLKLAYTFPLQHTFVVLDATMTEKATSEWSYVKNAYDRPEVLIWKANSEASKSMMITRGGYQGCVHGVFSVDLRSECGPQGIIGLVFRYESPSSYSVLELGKDHIAVNHRRNEKVYVDLPVEPAQSTEWLDDRWIHVTFQFEGPTFQARVYPLSAPNAIVTAKFRLNRLVEEPKNLHQAYKVGLAVEKCHSVVFDALMVGPSPIVSLQQQR